MLGSFLFGTIQNGFDGPVIFWASALMLLYFLLQYAESCATAPTYRWIDAAFDSAEIAAMVLFFRSSGSFSQGGIDNIPLFDLPVEHDQWIVMMLAFALPPLKRWIKSFRKAAISPGDRTDIGDELTLLSQIAFIGALLANVLPVLGLAIVTIPLAVYSAFYIEWIPLDKPSKAK